MCLTIKHKTCILKSSTKRAQKYGGDKLDNKAIAQRLIELRGDRSQKTVADACGISTSALAMYEQGNRIPRDDIKLKLSKYYKRSVNYIFFT